MFFLSKSVNPADYEGLLMCKNTRMLLYEEPEKFLACCNGVGSQIGGVWSRLLYKIIPNTIWFLNITKASNIHDVEYTYPDEFESREEAFRHKQETDDRFYWNLLELIRIKGGIFRRLREKRAFAYYIILKIAGTSSFFSGKIIGE